MLGSWRRYLAIVALTALYFAAGKFGLSFFGLLHPSASPVWLPTGIAMAALLLLGYRVWPAIFVGAFLVNATTEGSVVTSFAIAAGNTLEGLLAAYLVNRFAGGRSAFARATDILKFAGLACLGSTALSATIGVGALTLGGEAPVADSGSIWLTWWLGDAAGAAVIAPLLVLWYTDAAVRWTAKRSAEAMALLAAVIVTGLVVFYNAILEPYPLSFFSMPPLVWAAFRFGQREVATAVAILAAIAISGTASGKGPFVMATPNESLLVLQAFVVLVAMTALAMAALNTERADLLSRERAARAQAEAANRAKDNFLAVLSHELRNPLSAIDAARTVLDTLDDPKAADAQRWRAIIRRQTQHLTRLIDDLLDVARITADKMSLTRVPVDLGTAAERCVRTIAPLGVVDGRQIHVRAREAWVDADPDRLDQIINNLLKNAIRHTPPEGRILIDVRGDGDSVTLQVEDTGSGIRADLLPRVFDPFVQDDQGLERSGGGLGIGLTLVRRLAELHGGRVEARSEGRGHGSTLTVRLPRIDLPAGVGEHGDRATSEIAPNSLSRARGARILVVEDNGDTRDAVRALLEQEGYDTHEAPDGESGLAAALSYGPDLVLLDIGLPKLDGYEVARRLRSASPGVRLVALTGYGREEDRIRAREAGFDAHLLKPVDLERLRAVLVGLLDRP